MTRLHRRHARETADRAALFLWMLDPNAGACSVFPLEVPLRIGRGAEHDVVLQEAEASRLHATISRMGPSDTRCLPL